MDDLIVIGISDNQHLNSLKSVFKMSRHYEMTFDYLRNGSKYCSKHFTTLQKK